MSVELTSAVRLVLDSPGRGLSPGAYPRGGGIKGFISPELPTSDLTADAEYVANLVNVSIRPTMQFITWVCYFVPA